MIAASCTRCSDEVRHDRAGAGQLTCRSTSYILCRYTFDDVKPLRHSRLTLEQDSLPRRMRPSSR